MCLLSNSKIPLIAEEDIPCYKVLFRSDRKDYISPFGKVRYNIGGFNYPKDKYNEECVDVTMVGSPLFRIGRGFLHCYTVECFTYDCFSLVYGSNKPRFFECYIPKGSKYFISADGKEICGDKLFVKRNKYTL